MSKILRSPAELAAYLQTRGLSWQECFLPPLEHFSPTFPLRIPQYYADLIEWHNPDDPLRLLVVPDPQEEKAKPYELRDPIGDHDHEVVPGLIHRYPDRCLLLLTTYCLVHCRFCFRREVVGKVRPVEFQRIVRYIQQHSDIQEVIFSGGDPFTFPVGFLASLQDTLGTLDQVKIWRFHTRVPATDPTAVSDEFIEQLKQFLHLPASPQLIIVVHIDHPREITPEFRQLVAKLRSIGAVMLSQTVLLKNVNNDYQTLRSLFRGLIQIGVKPYYLHHLDQVVGSDHFRISIAEGKKLYFGLRGHLSGVALPEYVIDLPGGHGKVPISWLETKDGKTYTATTFKGEKVTYVDHATG